MDYILDNGKIKVTVSSLGAELRSLIKDGREYIWQGNPDYWTGHAPNLFPIVGRVKEGKYTCAGVEYSIKSPHGFARITEFEVEEKTDSKIVFSLHSGETTKKSYPYDFVFKVTHEIKNATLSISYTVVNPSDGEILFSVGAHPGFNLPLADGEKFEDDWLEFDEESAPSEVVCENCYPNGERRAFALEDGRIIRLRHDLFDNDAIILSDLSCRRVTVKSPNSDRFVRVCFDDMAYVGFWHKPLCAAPYMCIEPWNGLPSLLKAEEKLEEKPAIMRLAAGRTYNAGIEISVN